MATTYVPLLFGFPSGYRTVKFAREVDAVRYFDRKASVASIEELESEPVPESWTTLLARLYPLCEHQMPARSCYGPQHYYFDEEEQARGMLNGW